MAGVPEPRRHPHFQSSQRRYYYAQCRKRLGPASRNPFLYLCIYIFISFLYFICRSDASLLCKPELYEKCFHLLFNFAYGSLLWWNMIASDINTSVFSQLTSSALERPLLELHLLSFQFCLGNCMWINAWLPHSKTVPGSLVLGSFLWVLPIWAGSLWVFPLTAQRHKLEVSPNQRL